MQYQPITFTVSSGAICFGPLHDIDRASTIPIQRPAENPKPKLGGTVASCEIEHNIAAQNGAWTAYPLLRTKWAKNPAAWFVAHEQVSPLPEIHKLLRVAGSPYEYEHGHATNCDATRSECVLLINRYDWDDIPPGNPVADEDIGFEPDTLGVVDYQHAATQVQAWAANGDSADRNPSQHGVWLHCPDAEYKWARLGMNQDYTHARSLLIFNIYTVFFDTWLPGQTQPLRNYETSLERFHRHLREGHDFSGISTLREWWDPVQELNMLFPSQPPQHADLLGPYEKRDHILLPSELKALLADVPRESEDDYRKRGLSEESIQQELRRKEPAIMAKDFEEDICEVMNQIMLSYLEHFVLPLRSSTSASSLGTDLFPNHSIEGAKSVDGLMMAWFLDGVTSAADPTIIGTRIRSFLQRRTSNTEPFLLGQHSILCLAQVITAMVREIFEFADGNAIGREKPEERKPGERPLITPREIRMQVYYGGFLSSLQYSAFFWYGADPERPEFRRYER